MHAAKHDATKLFVVKQWLVHTYAGSKCITAITRLCMHVVLIIVDMHPVSRYMPPFLVRFMHDCRKQP